MRTLEDRWSEISPLLDEALDLPCSAREAWLADLALLAQVDVEQALGHAEEARQSAAEALSQLAPTVGADHPLTTKAAMLVK